jgi:hypothetical protein
MPQRLPSYALFFMDAQASQFLDKSDGWAVGSDPSVVVIDKGAGASIDSTTLSHKVVAVPFGQNGLMAGLANTRRCRRSFVCASPRPLPGFDAMLRDATRRRFDVLMFWPPGPQHSGGYGRAGGLGGSRRGMDATTPHGRAMLQMAAVFAELERGMIRERVMAGLARVRAEGKKTLGRPKVGRKVEDAIRARLSTGDGMLKVSKAFGVGVSTVMRVRKAMRPLPDAAL